MVEPLLRAPDVETDRKAFGLRHGAVAAVLFAVNGAVSKVILSTGLSSPRLSQVRSAGAFVVLAIAIGALRPQLLRVGRRELAFLALFGVAGLVSVQLFYFLAIHRLDIGIALLIQYLAPLLVALWARYAMHEYVRRRIFVALALSLGGLALMVEVWRGVALDGLGVTLRSSPQSRSRCTSCSPSARSPHAILSVSCYGFLFAALFWSLAQPWWSFPARSPGATSPSKGISRAFTCRSGC